MPLDVGGQLVEASLGAPGWWMAGDELVVAQVASGTAGTWRILGRRAGPSQPSGIAESLARDFEGVAHGERVGPPRCHQEGHDA
jgi:hypothetical protein